MISKEEMFSKYRALDINSEPLTIKNNKQNARLFDILKHKRLHATSFCNLNDTLESAFTYDIKELSKEDLINFYNAKMDKTKNICSFSIAKNDIYEASDQCEHLMWAHYANAHKGVRIDFKLKNDYEHVQKVNYVYKLTEIKKEDIKKEDTLNEIMTTKLKIWKYEKEARIISTNTYIDIIIKRIVLGRGFHSSNSQISSDSNFKIIALTLKNLLGDDSVEFYMYENKYSNKLHKIQC